MNSSTALFWFQVLTFVGAVLAAIGGFGAFHFSRRVEIEKEAASTAEQTTLNQKISELLAGNSALQSSLEPFKALARDRFPGTDVTTALKRLEQELARIDAITKPTVMKVQSQTETTTTEGKHRVVVQLEPIGSSTIPILAIGVRTTDGTKIEKLEITGPTIPLMATVYSNEDSQMHEFRTVSPGLVTITVTLPKKPVFLRFDVNPLAPESITIKN